MKRLLLAAALAIAAIATLDNSSTLSVLGGNPLPPECPPFCGTR